MHFYPLRELFLTDLRHGYQFSLNFILLNFPALFWIYYTEENIIIDTVYRKYYEILLCMPASQYILCIMHNKFEHGYQVPRYV